MSPRRNLLLFVIAATSLSACGKKDAELAPLDTAVVVTPAPTVPRVLGFELGHAVDSTRRISGGVSSTFSPRDTVWLSVRTENTGANSMLSARWSFQDGQRVDSTAQAVANRSGAADAVTEFHISKPGGWPAGQYKVEVFLDGASQGIKDFEIRR